MTPALSRWRGPESGSREAEIVSSKGGLRLRSLLSLRGMTNCNRVVFANPSSFWTPIAGPFLLHVVVQRGVTTDTDTFVGCNVTVVAQQSTTLAAACWAVFSAKGFAATAGGRQASLPDLAPERFAPLHPPERATHGRTPARPWIGSSQQCPSRRMVFLFPQKDCHSDSSSFASHLGLRSKYVQTTGHGIAELHICSESCILQRDSGSLIPTIRMTESAQLGLTSQQRLRLLAGNQPLVADLTLSLDFLDDAILILHESGRIIHGNHAAAVLALPMKAASMVSLHALPISEPWVACRKMLCEYHTRAGPMEREVHDPGTGRVLVDTLVGAGVPGRAAETAGSGHSRHQRSPQNAASNYRNAR